MKKRRWIPLLVKTGLLAVSVAALVAPLALRRPALVAEPSFQGQPLGVWLEILGRRGILGDMTKYDQAEQAIREMGTNSVPFLARALRYKQPAWKRKFYAAINRVPAGLVPKGMKQDKLEIQREGAAAALCLSMPGLFFRPIPDVLRRRVETATDVATAEEAAMELFNLNYNRRAFPWAAFTNVIQDWRP